MKHILAHDRTRVIQAISEAPDGHIVEIKAPIRSDEQNRLYWAELGKLADKHGHTPSLWHEYFLRQFVKPETAEIANEVIIMRPSTTKLSKQEFSDYIETVFAWIAENLK